MKIDYCFILSVVVLAVILPVGFTVDHQKFVGECNSPPQLYLSERDVSDAFINFIKSAKSSIKLITRLTFPLDLNKYSVDSLKDAQKRGVNIEMLINDNGQIDNKTFPHVEFFPKDTSTTIYISFAIADEKRLFYASRLLDKSNSSTEYALYFDDCASMAQDALGIYNFFKMLIKNNHLNLFPHSYIPGYSYPARHMDNKGGNYTLAIGPPRFVCPNRYLTYDLVNDFFGQANGNISVCTDQIFPADQRSVSTSSVSTLIETTASRNNNTNIKILLSSSTQISPSILSMSMIPRIEIRKYKFKQNMNAPSYFVSGRKTIFLPLPFDVSLQLDIVSLSLTVENDDIAKSIKGHFNDIWTDSKPV